MIRLKQIITWLLICFLLISVRNSAQAQFIGNNSFTGEYEADQNAIINNNPANIFSTKNDVTGTAEVNFLGGSGNDIDGGASVVRSSFLYGSDNKIENDVIHSFTFGRLNEIRENVESSGAIGENNEIVGIANESFAIGNNNEIEGVDFGFAIGRFIENLRQESMVLGYGAGNIDPLNSLGPRSITFGTYNKASDITYNALNIRPPSTSAVFDAPLVGIGEPDPEAKLEIVNAGATVNTAKALQVESSGNLARFNVREDGWTGFSADPGAPYYFEPTATSPPGFAGGKGKANIVQNIDAFPNFKDVGQNPNNEEAKWLALGERPPASSTNSNDQVAYGLANVWENSAGNFILIDQNPGVNGQTDEKDVAITFQDVWNQNSGSELTNPSNAGNRLVFLFRNSNDIDGNNSKFEVMSMEPTGEVGVGDYRASTPEANLEVKGDPNDNISTLFEVQRNGSPTNSGNGVFTVNDDGNSGFGTTSPQNTLDISGNAVIGSGFAGSNSAPTDGLAVEGNVGIGTSSPSEKLVVDGFVIPNSDGVEQLGKSGNKWKELWAQNSTIQTSDRRLKSDVDSLKYGLKHLMRLSPISYYNKGQKIEGKHLGLIAQDLEKVIQEPVETGSDKRNLKGVRYTALIPVLINGMQEQQKQVQKQQKQIRELQNDLKQEKAEKAAMKEKIKQLSKKVNQLAEQVNGVSKSFKKADDESLNQKTATLSNEDSDQAMLLQNRPNPYSNESVIPYYLPENAQNVNILITNSQGQMLKRIPLEGTGKGELTLQTADLNKGQYQYTLIIDGRQIQTRKMIVK